DEVGPGGGGGGKRCQQQGANSEQPCGPSRASDREVKSRLFHAETLESFQNRDKQNKVARCAYGCLGRPRAGECRNGIAIAPYAGSRGLVPEGWLPGRNRRWRSAPMGGVGSCLMRRRTSGRSSKVFPNCIQPRARHAVRPLKRCW